MSTKSNNRKYIKAITPDMSKMFGVSTSRINEVLKELNIEKTLSKMNLDLTKSEDEQGDLNLDFLFGKPKGKKNSN